MKKKTKDGLCFCYVGAQTEVGLAAGFMSNLYDFKSEFIRTCDKFAGFCSPLEWDSLEDYQQLEVAKKLQSYPG